MLANLLSPVGAGTLSQSISQQEYSQFFGRERLGISSYTEYFSRGNWIQRGSHYGTLGGLSYAIDVDYLKQNGFAPNTDQERLNLYGKFKQQLGEKDQLFFQMQYGRHEGGDWLQYLDPHQARSTFRYRSRQDPNLYIGWHREWSPTQRTLFLLGHLQNRVDFTDASAVIPLIQRSNPSAPPHTIQLENAPRYQLDHQSEFKGWSVEGQHIARVREHTLIGGIRWQTGESRRSTTQEAVPGQPLLDGRFSPRSQEVRSSVGLLSVYAYDIWELRDSMHLTAGLSYDWAEFPLNEDMAPLTGDVGRRERLSPRLGWQWSPSNNTHLRAAWTRSLGGSSPGNPARLEPVHIAGFTQAYAALTPESLTGLVPGLALETVHLGMDRKFRSRTFVGLVAEYLRGTGQRSLGAYDLTASPFQELEALSLSQRLRYEERTVYLTVNQLLGESWSLGGGYRYSEGDLKLNYDVVHAGAGGELNQDLQSTWHRWDVWGQYAHSSGFFAQVVGRWNLQSNSGLGHSGDENFWQMDLYAGYRWWQRRMEARIGLLNVTDQDYRLSPLNVREEYPRQRMIYGSFRFQF